MIPPDIQKQKVAIQPGRSGFATQAIAQYEQEFWREHAPRSWKWVKSLLPVSLPGWVMHEAETVWLTSRQRYGGYYPAVSLVSSRRHFFQSRKAYYHMSGQEETDEERQQRLEYDRDSRLMAAFYRLINNHSAREDLLRKTKIPAAKRLAGLHSTGLRKVQAEMDTKFTEAWETVEAWTTEALTP